jgi:hypothetical protein
VKNPKTHPTYSHGHSIRGCMTSTYRTWKSMKERCTSETSKAYPQYGGKGITLCDEWYSFDNFLADMGERPDGTTIDRVDNSKGYIKSNCRWATKSQQSINRSNWSSSSGYPGVKKTPTGKFQARFNENGTNFHLGTYDSDLEAFTVRQATLKEWTGEEQPNYEEIK